MTTMRLPEIEILHPGSLKEALEIKADLGTDCVLMAGGTDVVPLLKRRNLNVSRVISLGRVAELAALEVDDDSWLSIGAGVGLRDLLDTPAFVEDYPGLAKAIVQVAYTQIRNRATLVGNLCLDSKCGHFNQSALWWASREDCLKRGGTVCHVVRSGKSCHALAAADTVPALIALHAEAEIASINGRRRLPVAEMFTGRGTIPLALEPDEVVTAVKLPPAAPGWRETFIKISPRGAVDFAQASLAARLRIAGDRLMNARLVLGAVATAPVRITEAEKILIEDGPTPEAVERAGQAALDQVKPLSLVGAEPGYRRALINALISDAVSELTA